MAKHMPIIAIEPDAADPEDFPVTVEALDAARAERRARRGRPVGSTKADAKQRVTLRIDPDVLNAYRGSGPGWQVRMNEALRRAVNL